MIRFNLQREHQLQPLRCLNLAHYTTVLSCLATIFPIVLLQPEDDKFFVSQRCSCLKGQGRANHSSVQKISRGLCFFISHFSFSYFFGLFYWCSSLNLFVLQFGRSISKAQRVFVFTYWHLFIVSINLTLL